MNTYNKEEFENLIFVYSQERCLSVDVGAYWRKLKQRFKQDGTEAVTKCHELKFMALSIDIY